MKKSIITVLCIFVFVATAFADSNLSSFCASDSTEYYKSLYKLYLNTNLQLQTDTREKSQIINNLRDELNSLRIELDSLHAFKQEYVKIKIKEALSHVKALTKIRLTKKIILSSTVRHGCMVSMEGVGVGYPLWRWSYPVMLMPVRY